ncbi:hypothetical protein ACF1A9_29045 [Streptomyces sp. NPDC014872]|uniref:hypothetical protein n=1 Tax=Streptomyces sp. NPDC014872 TaxID=3364926 RepID=UPI0036FCEF9D
MKRFGAVPTAPWPRWALLRGGPCAAVALGVIGLALAMGVNSTLGTAFVIVAAVGALFTFVLTMPRRSSEREEG